MAEYLLKNGAGSIPELTGEDEKLLIEYHNQNMMIGHACFSETAYIMGIAPETVRLDRLGIESGKCLHKTDYLAEAGIKFGGWGIDYPNDFAGDDPVGCNERIGKATVRFEAERLANIYKVYKEDENLLKWQAERQRGW